MLCACRVQAMQILLSMKNVNIGCLKTGTQQSLDRRSGVLGIDNRPDDPMGRIGDEIASFMPVVRPFCYPRIDALESLDCTGASGFSVAGPRSLQSRHRFASFDMSVRCTA